MRRPVDALRTAANLGAVIVQRRGYLQDVDEWRVGTDLHGVLPWPRLHDRHAANQIADALSFRRKKNVHYHEHAEQTHGEQS